MSIIDFIRILQRHLVLLIVTPVVLAALVLYMTRKPEFRFVSETMLYTGIATGSSVEMDKTVSALASNTSFDNLINLIKSRQTHQEVAIRLLAQHLLLEKADPRFITAQHFAEFRKNTPDYIRKLVVRNDGKAGQPALPDLQGTGSNDGDTTAVNETFSFFVQADSARPSWLPPSVSRQAFDETVTNLTNYLESSDTNFIYKLLNYAHPHYSIRAISSVKVQRVGMSDLVSLKYETNDPAVCQQTLEFMTQVCIKNYRSFKENRSDVVVKYFEFQLKQAAARLSVAEDKLLKFNTDNNIINYYEQSKAVAGVKEQLDLDYYSKRVTLAGVQAAIARLEEKLGSQDLIQLRSSKIIDLRDRLGAISYKIASLEFKDSAEIEDIRNLAMLKAENERLKEEIKESVSDLYKYGHSTDGLPIASILQDWISKVLEAENTKAGLVVMAQKIADFQKQYSIYAPAGANLKRIEREISVAEREFLEILHGLNEARLRMQDNELSSNLKAIDPPYFPLSPVPNNRKMLVVIGALVGFIIVLVSVMLMEYTDDSLKNPDKASRILKLPVLGIFPKILLKVQNINFLFITNRVLEMAIQNIELSLKTAKPGTKTRTLLIFSTLGGEGKSVLASNLAQKLKLQGKRVLVLDFSHEALTKTETAQIGYRDVTAKPKPVAGTGKKQRFSILNFILGYPDPRIDTDSPFLEDPEKRLSPDEYFVYDVNDKFYTVNSYEEILEQGAFRLTFVPDYVLVELPPVLYYPYPVNLVTQADMPVMVCRANRVWSKADQGAVDVISRLTGQPVQYVLNGVELSVIESVLGDLPKRRSRFRRLVKKLVRLEFYSRNHI